jgi:tetratricopeptide (TPR) repeat protein
MTEASSRGSARFCPGCGEAALAGARFCVSCGQRLAGSLRAARGPVPTEAIAVLVAFLAVGLTLWAWLLAPAPAAQRMPLAPRSQEEAAAPSAGSVPAAGEGGMPANHPPLEVPADVKKYIAELAKDAAAKPKDLGAWKTLAQVQYRAGQVDKSYLGGAEESFRHVLELDAKDLDAFRGLGNVHFDREEYAQAVDWYGKYLAAKPDDLNVRTDLGTMYLYGGQPDRAIAEYDKVLANDPKFYQAHYNLGIAYAQQGDKDKALASLKKASEYAPDDATRKQIESMLDHATSPGGGTVPASSGETAATAAGGFQATIENDLRAHPIVGPKIVKFDWPSETAGQVRLRDFPMQAMPETIRQKFLDRLKTDLAEAKKKSPTSGEAKLELVDDKSGTVMATVTAE